MAARQPLLTFLPLVTSLVSLILILLILLAGTNNTLSSLYYLKTDVTGLTVTPKLSSSTFLQDLTAASHKDLVGQPSTATSLGLGETYTLLLLTSCAHFSNGAVSCAQPSLGFSFDPRSELRLDSTSLQGTYPQPFLDALARHRKATRAIAAVYILGALLTALAPLGALFARRARAAGIAAAALAILSAALLLSASIVGIVVTKDLNAQFNDALGESGLSSSVGSRPTALSFVASALAVVTAAIFVARARDDTVGGGIGGGAYVTGTGGGAGQQQKRTKKGGLLGFIPGLGRHRYVPVEKQLLARAAAPGGQEDVVFDAGAGGAGRRGLGDDWAAVDEYSAGGGHGIPMKALGGNAAQRRGVDDAYEPYSHAPS